MHFQIYKSRDRTGAAGTSWQQQDVTNSASTNHTVGQVFTVNDQVAFNASNNTGSHQVALYAVSINTNQSRTLSRAGGTATYNSGELQVAVTRDENWQPGNGCDGTWEKYKDKNGHFDIIMSIRGQGRCCRPITFTMI